VKIPKGMTEREVTETITKVVNRYAKKFKFSYHEIDDIKQEGFMIGMEALERYDTSRPLENFLAVHIKNRLKNFKRDNFFRYDEELEKTASSNKDLKRVQRNNVRKFLLFPIDIDSVRQEGEGNMSTSDKFIADVELKELMTIIDRKLSVSYRKDYLKMRDGVYVSKTRREEVCEEIQKIIKEYEN
jgi:DNA-directed RNA polymerase specialized sigma subunit